MMAVGDCVFADQTQGRLRFFERPEHQAPAVTLDVPVHDERVAVRGETWAQGIALQLAPFLPRGNLPEEEVLVANVDVAAGVVDHEKPAVGGKGYGDTGADPARERPR